MGFPIFAEIESMRKPFLFFMAISCFLAACEKEPAKVDCNALTAPTVSYPGAIDAGDSLSFFVTTSGNPVSYSWTGPNGFSSNEKNGSVHRIQANGAGKYSLTVNYGDNCTKSFTTDSIRVMIPVPPCTTSPNSANLSDTALATFNTFTSQYAGSVYSFTPNGPNGKIVMQFLNTNKPAPGVYVIQPLGGISEFGFLRFRFDASGESWQTSTGKVYVTESGGKNTYTFCQVVARGSLSGHNITMTGRVTEP